MADKPDPGKVLMSVGCGMCALPFAIMFTVLAGVVIWAILATWLGG